MIYLADEMDPYLNRVGCDRLCQIFEKCMLYRGRMCDPNIGGCQCLYKIYWLLVEWSIWFYIIYSYFYVKSIIKKVP